MKGPHVISRRISLPWKARYTLGKCLLVDYFKCLSSAVRTRWNRNKPATVLPTSKHELFDQSADEKRDHNSRLLVDLDFWNPPSTCHMQTFFHWRRSLSPLAAHLVLTKRETDVSLSLLSSVVGGTLRGRFIFVLWGKPHMMQISFSLVEICCYCLQNENNCSVLLFAISFL